MAWTHQSLDRTIQDLKSKNEETKIKAANDLRENVVLYSRGNVEPRSNTLSLTVLSRACSREIRRILQFS